VIVLDERRLIGEVSHDAPIVEAQRDALQHATIGERAEAHAIDAEGQRVSAIACQRA